MNEELEEELAIGGELSLKLVEHLRRMGAGSLKIPVVLEDETFLVSVEHRPIEP